jgi:hypothetical protein
VHDLGHPGLNNDFLIATNDSLAVRYNDRAPLENHHAASLFELVARPELNALAVLTTGERKSFRKLVSGGVCFMYDLVHTHCSGCTVLPLCDELAPS